MCFKPRLGDIMKEVKFISFGGGQCSSAMLFLGIECDFIIFADTGNELPLTYAWIDIVQGAYPDKFIRIKTEHKFKQCHHPICTKEAKILPIRRYLRSIGVKKAVKYLGYTIDERKRAKPNGIKWVENQFPLIEMGLTRKDCQQILIDKVGFVPPRSSCMICKFFDREHLIPGQGFRKDQTEKTLYNYIA